MSRLSRSSVAADDDRMSVDDTGSSYGYDNFDDEYQNGTCILLLVLFESSHDTAATKTFLLVTVGRASLTSFLTSVASQQSDSGRKRKRGAHIFSLTVPVSPKFATAAYAVFSCFARFVAAGLELVISRRHYCLANEVPI